MQSVTETIRRKLDARFKPMVLSVTDDSAMHAGHTGSRPQGESHFSVSIVSDSFTGLTRVARHRLVYEALGEEFKEGLHALVIQALTPKEAARV